MIKPINNHVLIEPIKHESFMFSERATYDEVGVVLDVSGEMTVKVPTASGEYKVPIGFKVGDKVFFDSWLAAKFPKGDGGEEYYWLVPLDSIKAYEPLPA